VAPHRRTALLCALAAAAAIGAVAFASGRRCRPAARPNVVLFVWDTCRGDRVSVNGYARPTTPRLAAFAATGTTFRACFSPAPWTPPAHASLFTGLLPRTHGLREGMGDRVRPGIPLLARTLRDAGYETVCVAANPAISVVTGLDEGFEHHFPCFRTDEGRETADAARDRVRDWAARRRASGEAKRPVFLFVNLMDTHLPYVFDAAAVAAVRGAGAADGAGRAAAAIGDMETKAHVIGRREIPPQAIRDLDAAYDGAVHRTDRVTGEILDDLRAEGLLDRAFVAICADHGENLGEHREMNHVLSVYEPVLHVPLVVSWPGRLDGGRVVDTPVALQDVYPTILEAAHVPVPAPCGKDAVPLTEASSRPRHVVSEYGPMLLSLPEARAALPDAPPEAFDRFRYLYRAVREPGLRGGLKLVSVLRAGERGDLVPVREELYDLASDPRETKDLLAPGGHPSARAGADRLRAAGRAGR
jgi:arylsulfatase A-like enzyme